jgi:hypothetical protein
MYLLSAGGEGRGRGRRGEEGVKKGVNTVNFRVYLVFDSAHSFALHCFT